MPGNNPWQTTTLPNLPIDPDRFRRAPYFVPPRSMYANTPQRIFPPTESDIPVIRSTDREEFPRSVSPIDILYYLRSVYNNATR